MLKFYTSFDGIMQIKELTENEQKYQCKYEKLTNTYKGVKVFNSIQEAIKDLGSYGKITILPNGDKIIPNQINYPNFYGNVLKRVIFPIQEVDPI